MKQPLIILHTKLVKHTWELPVNRF